MTISVGSANDLARVFKQVEHGRITQQTRAVIAAGLMGVRYLRSKEPIDTGNLRQQTKLEVNEACFHPGFSGVACSIRQEAPYAAALEFGSRPHWAPYEAILAWAIRQRANLNVVDIESFARAVWVKISQQGTPPMHYTRDSLPVLQMFLNAKLRAAANQGGNVSVEAV